jgi:hypothetical protein
VGEVQSGTVSAGSGSTTPGTPAGTLSAMAVVLALVMSVVLGAPFGKAEARALEVDTGMTIEVSVELDGGRSAVLARVVAFAGELPAVALVDQGDGRWVGLLRLSGREDVQVAFEAIDAGGATDISDLSTLTELGVDPAIVAPTRPTVPPSPDPGPNWWLIAGLVTGIVAIALLVWWALSGSVDKRSNNPDNTKDADQTNDDPGSGVEP